MLSVALRKFILKKLLTKISLRSKGSIQSLRVCTSSMEEKSLDEQLDILNGPLGQKLRHVHELKSESYKAKIWANYEDAEKRRTIQRTKTLIDKVKSSSV